MKHESGPGSKWITILLSAGLFVLLLCIPISLYAKKKEASGRVYSKEDLTYHIILDPGHGGDDSGAEAFGTSEKKLTLKLAKMIREELLKYDNVTVDLTRTKDVFVELEERTEIALSKRGDLMVSLHFDAYDPYCAYSSGCSAIVAKKRKYRPAMAKEERRIARSILSELNEIGLKNHGLIRRLSADEYYPDGSKADYYAVIRNGMKKKLPTILVEHGFIDSSHDYGLFDSDEGLRELARADARGIARYLRLSKKDSGEILSPHHEHGEDQVCRIKEGSYISIRAKSYNIDLYRKGEATVSESLSEENDLADHETEGDEIEEKGTDQDVETEEAADEKDQSASNVSRQGTASESLTHEKAQQDAVYLILGLLAALALLYLLLFYKRKNQS